MGFKLLALKSQGSRAPNRGLARRLNLESSGVEGLDLGQGLRKKSIPSSSIHGDLRRLPSELLCVSFPTLPNQGCSQSPRKGEQEQNQASISPNPCHNPLNLQPPFFLEAPLLVGNCHCSQVLALLDASSLEEGLRRLRAECEDLKASERCIYHTYTYIHTCIHTQACFSAPADTTQTAHAPI